MQSVSDALQCVLDRFGSINVLVNNATIDPKLTDKTIVEILRLEHFPIDQWNMQINVGLTGASL